MVASISGAAFGVKDVLSECRNLKRERWVAAGVCVAVGLAGAVALGNLAYENSTPAQVIALAGPGASKVLAPADALAEVRRAVSAPAVLRKTIADLDLAESGMAAGGNLEQSLAAAIKIKPSSELSVIDIEVQSGTASLDTVIANTLARGLTTRLADAEKAAAPGASGVPVSFSLVGKSHLLPRPSVLLYQVELFILSLLLGASMIAVGAAGALRAKRAMLEKSTVPETVVPRGILEQIDMLERMWPETGRQNIMPEGSNDEPEQVEMKPARTVVVRMSELRQEALKAIEEPSEEAMEDVLSGMQSLRDQVRWITAEQLRRRRRVNSFGR